MKTVKGVALRVGADQRVVGYNGGRPHVGELRAPGRRVPVPRTPPARAGSDRRGLQSNNQGDRHGKKASHGRQPTGGRAGREPRVLIDWGLARQGLLARIVSMPGAIRDRILSKSRGLLRTERNPTVAQLAAAAGVSRTSFYREFESRAGLVRALPL